eukprot:1130230-Rhodomonas_salina.1
MRVLDTPGCQQLHSASQRHVESAQVGPRPVSVQCSMEVASKCGVYPFQTGLLILRLGVRLVRVVVKSHQVTPGFPHSGRADP